MLHRIDTDALYSGIHKTKGGVPTMVKNDQMQEIRMCYQTYFNLYGAAPSKQEMLEWLGTSYEDKIPEYPDQMFAA